MVWRLQRFDRLPAFVQGEWAERTSRWLMPVLLIPLILLYVGYHYGTARQIFLPWVLNRFIGVCT